MVGLTLPLSLFLDTCLAALFLPDFVPAECALGVLPAFDRLLVVGIVSMRREAFQVNGI